MRLPRPLILMFLLAGTTLAWGAEPNGNKTWVTDLSQQLVNGDSAQVQDAITVIRDRLKDNPVETMNYLRNQWSKPLLAAGRFDDVLALTQETILAAPHKTDDVEYLQLLRVRTFLLAQRPQEALKQAKSLFNVATMRSTDRAILQMTECLKVAHPDTPTIMERFRREQIAGATTRPMGDKPTTTGTLLAEIRVDSKPYEEAIKELVGTEEGNLQNTLTHFSFTELLRFGNLYLLADRPQDAQKCFNQAKQIADSNRDLSTANEGYARAVKAEDGCIGRANGLAVASQESGDK